MSVKFMRLTRTLVLVLISLLLLASCNTEQTPGSISGRVVLEDGASLAGLAITATGEDGSTYKALPDAKGNFSFEGMNAGTYTVTFSKPDYKSVTKDSVSVSNGKTADIGTVQLDFVFGYVKGKITDNEGNPLSGATVTIIGTNIRKYSATTDTSGNYSIKTKVGLYKELDAHCNCWSGHFTLGSQLQVSENKTASIATVYQLELTHNFEMYEMKEPTKTATGYRKYRCSTCGLEKTEELAKAGSAKWAGVRVSPYGMWESFGRYPDVDQMTSFAANMESCFEGSIGAYILIVGTVDEDQWTCHLDFPLSKSIDKAYGSEEDNFEEYLTAFDKAGYSVWLQVEPGDANLVELATEVMNRYKNHSCVKGFGIDVEWYKPAGTNGRGTKLSEEPATVNAVLSAVRNINSKYTVFVKHWDQRWLPEAKTGLVFVNDSQGFRTGKDSTALERMCDEFADWAETYAPCPVMFQIGYDADKNRIWGSMENPAKQLGDAILEGCDFGNDVGIIWVDFTLKEAMDAIEAQE